MMAANDIKRMMAYKGTYPILTPDPSSLYSSTSTIDLLPFLINNISTLLPRILKLQELDSNIYKRMEQLIVSLRGLLTGQLDQLQPEFFSMIGFQAAQINDVKCKP
jgi:hypothetical protein